MKRMFAIAALLPVLAGCDQLKERLNIADPAKIEAVGKAVGGACRHAGRGLEDCYQLNPTADKPSVFMGWKEMNEYMIKNSMQAMKPEIPVTPPPPPVVPGAGHAAKDAGAEAKDGHGADAQDGKDAEAKTDTKTDTKADAKTEAKTDSKADAKAEGHAKPAGH